MTEHQFPELYDRYPETIVQMENNFNSHEFILKLAQQNQRLYIEALYHFRDRDAPFRALHALLSRRLRGYPQLIRDLGQVTSNDIFGNTGDCASWEKIQAG